ncbi:MAG: glycosyltransferase family 39 protein [Anaerolineales bacterium]|nr:glycosyltransferase family 39 protein [Anaerolineales bacterium]
MNKKLFLKDLYWIIPVSLFMGAMFSFVQPGNPWTGLFVSAVVNLLGLLGLTAAWRWAGGGRTLFMIVSIALLLRFFTAVAFYVYLPVYGYADSEQQQAGYVYFDSFRRDTQAWELAHSGTPVLKAFDKQYYTDQYGGFLALSAGIYRVLSPDTHRPLLVTQLGALVAVLGIIVFWIAVRQVWGSRVALPAVFIFAFFPEAILLAGAQMREPFLITFTAMAWWGFLEWEQGNARSALAWTGVALAGMLLVSPVIALTMLIVLGGWRLLEQDHGRVSWKVVLGTVIIFITALVLLTWGLDRTGSFGANTPAGILVGWFREAVKWTTYQLERGSGWVQKLFQEMPPQWRLLFVTGYGMAQPVLPASLIEPTTILWRILGILRSLGWYLLAPLLLYGWFAARQTPDHSRRRILVWLGTAAWLWVMISALRAGGDQWDNPRYRTLMLIWMAVFAGYAWDWWRVRRDAWLLRILSAEGVFLGFFTQWYLSRYYHLGEQLPFGIMVLLILVGAGLSIGGSWLWDRYRSGAGGA